MTGRSGVSPELTPRDVAVLTDLDRVRLLTGGQIERLQFAGLVSPYVRSSSRRRVMARLKSLRLITTLPRQIGGIRAGSAGLVYALDSRGQQWAARRADREPTARVRRPWSIGSPFVAHTLDVSELYVRLRELERRSPLSLLRFAAEPASWHRTASVLLKPDAFALWQSDGWEHYRWIEVDRASESVPTVRRKLLSYVTAAALPNTGFAGVFPTVIVTVPSPERATAIAQIVRSLPAPAPQLISVTEHAHLFRSIDSPAPRPPP